MARVLPWLLLGYCIQRTLGSFLLGQAVCRSVSLPWALKVVCTSESPALFLDFLFLNTKISQSWKQSWPIYLQFKLLHWNLNHLILYPTLDWFGLLRLLPQDECFIFILQNLYGALFPFPLPYTWFDFLPCLLTRLSEPSDSWPRNKSKIVLLNEYRWKLGTKSGKTQREDTGGEQSWVCNNSQNGKTGVLYWVMVIDNPTRQSLTF